MCTGCATSDQLARGHSVAQPRVAAGQTGKNFDSSEKGLCWPFCLDWKPKDHVGDIPTKVRKTPPNVPPLTPLRSHEVREALEPYIVNGNQHARAPREPRGFR